MKVKLSKNSLLPIAFFVLTIQNSSVLIAMSISRAIEYIGLALLLFGGISSVIESYGKQRRQWTKLFLLCVVLMCIGLLRQDLKGSRILYLCISYVLLAFVAIFPNDFLSSPKIYREIAKAVLMATIVATILCLVNDYSVLTGASEGIIVNYGFNGGMEHRNYYAYSMLGCFILYDLDKTIFRKRKKGMLILSFILMVISNSRGCLIIFAVYYVFANYRMWTIQGIGKKVTRLLIVIVMVLIGIPAYQLVVSNSETFSFRVNGLNNYINYVTGDWEHIVFGNAAMAFAETGMTYDQNIRSVIGWNGSVELVVLNIMIKSGLIGLVAFVLIFINFFRKIRRMKWDTIEARTYAIYFSFLVSALVEAYVGTLNLMYSPLCYMLLATLPYMQAEGSLPFKRKLKIKSMYYGYAIKTGIGNK